MSVKTTMKRTWPVLLAYALFSMWGAFCLMASIILTGGASNPKDMFELVGVFIALGVGHLIGNAIGLVGFRLVPITIIMFSLFFGAIFAGAALGPFVIYFILAAFAAYGGYLGIGSRLDVVAAWYPLTLSVGAAITWMNHHHAIATFESGAKHQLWDAFTIVCLGGGVFWMLVFLATRNALGLTVWQEVARPKNVNVEQDDIAVARPGRGSFIVLLAFTIVILGATALVSPYLFRTAQGKDGGGQQQDDDGQGEQQHEGQGEGKDGKFAGKKTHGQGRTDGKPSQQEGQGQGKGKGKGKGQGQGDQGDQGDDQPDPEHAQQAAEDAAKLAFKIVAWLIGLAALLLFLYLVVMPPIRRAFLMRHLEKPLWPVPPTSRVMNHWRRALAVLAVVGIEPSAGETATDFAKRATNEVKEQLECDAPGLGEAAQVVEKIAYAGRGLGAADEAIMNTEITRFVTAVKPRIKVTRRFASAWGRPPEVES